MVGLGLWDAVLDVVAAVFQRGRRNRDLTLTMS
jgi:hypothetical protein